MIAVFSYRELIRNLVIKDLKLKYRDSAFGFLWSLANPLLLILVYSFVFGHIIPAELPNFSYFLLVGILPWNFFSQSLMMSTGAIVDNGSLIRKVALPREVFPVATVLFNLVQFLLAIGVFVPMTIVFFRFPLSASMLAFVPLLALQVLFTLGLSFVFATATVFYRDVRHFAEILLMLLFWLTPIIYDIRAIPEALRRVVSLNPVSLFILTYQDILYRQALPDADKVLGLTALSLFSLIAGYFFFSTYKPDSPKRFKNVAN